MGSVVRTIGQVAVDAVGYAVGGPLGFAVANLAFGLVFPESSQVQNFGDTNLEGSEIGIFIPEFYGQMGKVNGNVIDCSTDNDGKPAGILIRIKNEKLSAKGGLGAQTQRVEVGYLTAAYLIGKGPLYIDRITTQDSDGVTTIFDRYGKNADARGGDFTPEFAPDGTLIAEISDRIHLYYGTEYQMPDSTLQRYHSDLSAYRGVSYVVFNQFEIKSSPNFNFYVRSPMTGRSEIIVSRLLESGIPAARINLKNLWGRTNGAWVTTRDNARTLCEGLAKECFTDFVFPDGIIRDSSKCFTPRYIIDKSQMGALVSGDNNSADAATIEMKGDEEFASDFSIPFNDIDLNYDDNSAHAIRYTNNNQVVTNALQLPVSAKIDDMLPFAKILQDEQWIANRTLVAPLMPGNILISPGDVVNFPDLQFPISNNPTSNSDYYITEQDVSPEGIITLTGEPYDQNIYYPTDQTNIYGSDAAILVPRPITGPNILEPPLDLVLDCPFNDDAATRTGILYAACPPLLDGAPTYWAGSQFTPLTTEFDTKTLGSKSPMGQLGASYSYAAEEATRVNYDKTISVTMDSGSLVTATESDVLENHANMLAINTGDPANTLLLQFVTATKTGDYAYDISGLLPARQGTDYVNSIASGAKVLLLTDHNGAQTGNYLFLETNNHNIGREITYQSLAGNATKDVQTDESTFTFTANSRKPLSPVYVRVAERNVGTDVTLAWCARTRFAAGSVWTLTQASDPNNFLINFMSGATLIHALTVTDAVEVTITEADLTAWYGSLPSALTGTIAQISDLVGAGHTRSFSLTL